MRVSRGTPAEALASVPRPIVAVGSQLNRDPASPGHFRYQTAACWPTRPAPTWSSCQACTNCPIGPALPAWPSPPWPLCSWALARVPAARPPRRLRPPWRPGTSTAKLTILASATARPSAGKPPLVRCVGHIPQQRNLSPLTKQAMKQGALRVALPQLHQGLHDVRIGNQCISLNPGKRGTPSTARAGRRPRGSGATCML